jgi:hypothetical protein
MLLDIDDRCLVVVTGGVLSRGRSAPLILGTEKGPGRRFQSGTLFDNRGHRDLERSGDLRQLLPLLPQSLRLNQFD